MPVIHGNPELQDKLRMHLEFIRRSAEAMSAGVLEEALRVAVSLRVLFHDTSNSQSILMQMGVKETIRLKSYFRKLEPLPSSGRICIEEFNFLETPRLISVASWIGDPICRYGDFSLGNEGSTLEVSRFDIVLTVANKEGGAHVDLKMTGDRAKKYSKVASWIYNGEKKSIAYSYMGLMAKEVLESDELAQLF